MGTACWRRTRKMRRTSRLSELREHEQADWQGRADQRCVGRRVQQRHAPPGVADESVGAVHVVTNDPAHPRRDGPVIASASENTPLVAEPLGDNVRRIAHEARLAGAESAESPFRATRPEPVELVIHPSALRFDRIELEPFTTAIDPAPAASTSNHSQSQSRRKLYRYAAAECEPYRQEVVA